MSGAAPVDWAELARLGLGALRLPPEVFWGMTPFEFRAALEGAGLVGAGRGGAPSRAALEALMERFPDMRGGKR